MPSKESAVVKLKIAAQKIAVGSMDPMPHILAVALENESIATEVEKRLKGKMVGSARLLSTEGDLQSGIRGVVEIPFYTDKVDEVIKDPIYLFADLASKEARLVTRPVVDKRARPSMVGQPFVTGSHRADEANVVSLTPEAQARENAFFARHGLTPQDPFQPVTPSWRPEIEDLITEILRNRGWGSRGAASSQTTCTYDTTSTCVVFTSPEFTYDQRIQDDCEGDGFHTDD